MHVQQLPERCYALTVNYPLMIVGTADRHLVVFNLQNPQVIVLLNWALHVLFQFELGIAPLMASFIQMAYFMASVWIIRRSSSVSNHH